MVKINQNYKIKMEKITKSFGDFLALDHVNFNLCFGEVHALLGENGAGKSSLMNVLSGIYAPDFGEIIIDGKTVNINGPSDARRLGIGMVHQHFRLVKSFNAIDNIALVSNQKSYHRDTNNLRQKILKKMDEIGFELELDIPVGLLSVAEQQRVEILKVLISGASIIILDEPTAVLTDVESIGFFKIIRSLASSGTSVVLVTHKLKEAKEFSDKISVLRNGKIVDTVKPDELEDEALIKLIVGEVFAEKPRRSKNFGEEKIVISDLNLHRSDHAMGLTNINLKIREGEIYGIAGIGGNGQAELSTVLMGLTKLDSGSIKLAGYGDITKFRTDQRRKCGIVLIPADRQKYALAGELSVADNYAVSAVLSGALGGWMGVKKMVKRRSAEVAIEKFDIFGVQRLNQNAALLSGGNAQKLVIAREFSSKPSVVIAHSPSRGLDLKAAAFVHKQLLAARDAGAAVLLLSEDLDEIMLLSDTIGVINRGCITAEFSSPADRQKIGKAMVN